MKVSEMIARLQTHYLPDDVICAPIWQAADVQQVAEDMELPSPLSEEQLADVMEAMDQNHDACLGITWETIQYAIQGVVG